MWPRPLSPCPNIPLPSAPQEGCRGIVSCLIACFSNMRKNKSHRQHIPVFRMYNLHWIKKTRLDKKIKYNYGQNHTMILFSLLTRSENALFFWSSCLDDILSPPFCILVYNFFYLMRCADVHETLSLFSIGNVCGSINIYIFAELHIFCDENSEFLINTTAVDASVTLLYQATFYYKKSFIKILTLS